MRRARPSSTTSPTTPTRSTTLPTTRPAPRRWPGSRASRLRPAASRPGHHRPPWGPRLASSRSPPTGCSTPAPPAPSGSRSPTRARRCRSASSATARPRHPWRAVAVALNVTVTQADGTGFVTVFPTGRGPGRVAPELRRRDHCGRTSPSRRSAAQGRVSLYVQGRPPTSSSTSRATSCPPPGPLRAGLVPLAPARILDTRTGIGAPAVRPGPGATVTLTVLGRGGVPAKGVAAVILCLTGVGRDARLRHDVAGRARADRTCRTRNFDHVGEVRANWRWCRSSVGHGRRS